MKYKECKDSITSNVVSFLRIDDDGKIWSIPIDPDNTDYQAYLKWLEAGNTPEAADATHPYQQTQEHNQ